MNFACVAKNETIMISYSLNPSLNTYYSFTIIDCKPSEAISLIDTEIKIDFVQPKDYEELNNQKEINYHGQNKSIISIDKEEKKIIEEVKKVEMITVGGTSKMVEDPQAKKVFIIKKLLELYDPRQHKLLHGLVR